MRDVILLHPTDSVCVAARNLSAGATVEVPDGRSDPSHDSERSCSGELPPYLFGGPTCKTDAARTWFLRNPTSCTAPGIGLPITVRVDSWFDPGDFKSASTVSHLPAGYPLAPAAWGAPQGMTSCDLVPFEPTLSTKPEVPARSAERTVGVLVRPGITPERRPRCRRPNRTSGRRS